MSKIKLHKKIIVQKKLDKVVELVGGGSVINGATPSSSDTVAKLRMLETALKQIHNDSTA